jgi:hypothetical protein
MGQVVPGAGDGDGHTAAHHGALLCGGEAHRAPVKAVRHVAIRLRSAAMDGLGEVGGIGHPEMHGFLRHAEELGEAGIGGAEPAEVEDHRAVIRLMCARMVCDGLGGFGGLRRG